jgi:hypothetical protein
MEKQEITKVKQRVEQTLLKKKNVVGVGVGKKITKGQRTDQHCITVLVSQKLPLKALAAEDVVPKEVEGAPVDVIQVGTVRAFAGPTDKWRPAPGGVSIGHYKITAGTLGAVVKSRTTGKRMILSNNHVLANSNDSVAGDDILQPGPYDGGTVPQDVIARLDRFVTIQFQTAPSSCSFGNSLTGLLNSIAKGMGSSFRVQGLQISAATNLVDAALALPLADDLVKDEILEIGAVNGWTEEVEVGTAVKKSGRTTGLTEGTVEVLNATVNVQYGEGQIATFTGQYVAGPMSQGGDSGSLVVDGQKRAVGLLFAGSDQSTIFNPIKEVLSALDIDFP